MLIFLHELSYGTISLEKPVDGKVLRVADRRLTGEQLRVDNYRRHSSEDCLLDVAAYAAHLGIDAENEKHLLWIAEEALSHGLPDGWASAMDSECSVYFFELVLVPRVIHYLLMIVQAREDLSAAATQLS